MQLTFTHRNLVTFSYDVAESNTMEFDAIGLSAKSKTALLQHSLSRCSSGNRLLQINGSHYCISVSLETVQFDAGKVLHGVVGKLPHT